MKFKLRRSCWTIFSAKVLLAWAFLWVALWIQVTDAQEQGKSLRAPLPPPYRVDVVMEGDRGGLLEVNLGGELRRLGDVLVVHELPHFRIRANCVIAPPTKPGSPAPVIMAIVFTAVSGDGRHEDFVDNFPWIGNYEDEITRTCEIIAVRFDKVVLKDARRQLDKYLREGGR